MNKFNSILASSIFLATGTSQASVLQYTDKDTGEWFTLDNLDQASTEFTVTLENVTSDTEVFGIALSDYSVIVADGTPKDGTGRARLTLTDWQIDISKMTGTFSCPYCVIGVTTGNTTEFFNVSNLDVNSAEDLYFQGFTSRDKTYDMYYTAVDIGSPNSPAVSPVPVPAAVWLMGSGLLGLVGVARRKDNVSF